MLLRIALVGFLFGAAGIATSCGGTTKPAATATPVLRTEATLLPGGGGQLVLPDGTRLLLPSGALTRDVAGVLDESPSPPAPPEWGTALGTPVNIDIKDQTLTAPATLELPYDPSKLAPEATESQAFAAYYDEASGKWVPVGGSADPRRRVVVVQILHASWWAPWTWNWDAWLASLTKVLDLKVKSFLEAVRLLTESCAETTDHVTVDNSRNNSIAKGCIEHDDPRAPAVSVVNLKSFYIGVSASGGGGAALDKRILQPGEGAHITLNTSDEPPLHVSLEFTQDAMDAFLVHLVLQMLPAGDLVPEDGVGVIAHVIAGDAHIAAAIEDLTSHDGAAAAEEITAMLKEDAFIQTFVNAAVQYGTDHGIDILKKWTVSGVKKVLIGVSATNVIIETVDFIANYFFNNRSEVGFSWLQPVPTMTPRVTKVIAFTPDKVDVSGALPGKCWTDSLAIGVGAFRCMERNRISDPCFAVSGQPDYVLCPGDPQTTADDVVMQADLSQFKQFVPSRARPWFFVTMDGIRVGSLTGTLPSTPYGFTPYYPCFPPTQQGGLWVAECIDSPAGDKSVHVIDTIWF